MTKATPLFWRFQIVGWLVYALLTLPLKLVLFQSLGYALLVTLFRESFGFLITTGFRYLFRKMELRIGRPVILATVVLSLSFTFSAVDLLLGFAVQDLGGRSATGDLVFGIFCFRALLFTTWSVLYFTLRDLIAARERLASLRKAEIAVRDAEILMLRAQVSPHFLFNAFNTIIADLDDTNRSLVPVVRGLSDYFRYSLASHDQPFVKMEQEFDAIRSYLTVEKARFQDSLEIDCHLDPAAAGLEVPGIFLQPLVENALKHGYKTSPTTLRLRLDITGDGNNGAVVEVTNSGKWSAENPEQDGEGTGGQGLSVLRRRLELLYPGRHSLEILACDSEGTVTVRILLEPPHHTSQNHAV